MDANKKFKEFIGLIKWASRKYYKKAVPTFTYEDFVSEGQLVLTKCLRRWYHTPKDEHMGRVAKDEKSILSYMNRDRDFSKFFKTSLFNKYIEMVRTSFYKKYRDHQEISLEALENVEIGNSGFENILYQELIDYVCFLLKEEYRLPKDRPFRNEKGILEMIEAEEKADRDFELAKKIFLLLSDPPEGLCKLAIFSNRKRDKQILLGKPVRSNRVVPTTRLVIEYLNNSGTKVNSQAYYLHIKNIKKVVIKAVQK